MDILTIDNSLPNGFHDAYLVQLNWDFQKHEVRILLDLLMGNDDQPGRVRYKRSILNLRGCAVVLVEPAVAYRAIKSPRGVQIDRVDLTEADQRTIREVGYTIPDGNFWLAWFVYEWNARLIINAQDAHLEFSQG